MYRTNDPRFRRRLNEIGQTLESANESAQSGLYIFGQNYLKPCLESVGACVTSCVDASCPSLNLSHRDRRLRARHQHQQQRGRAELSFDFYDDWDEDENDALFGWGNDDFDRLVAGSGSGSGRAGYGTISQQPGSRKGMAYPKGRRKSAVPPHDGGPDPTVIPGSGGFWGQLFGGRTLRYKPSAAGLQEHPGSGKRKTRGRDLTEGEALLEEHEEEGLWTRGHRRERSGTQGSHDTADSYSSRGDIFPSDGEDDAVPLDDEFAMVLERRMTQSGSGLDLATPSMRSESKERQQRGKRPSAGSRTSTRRTVSSKSTHSSGGRKSRAGSTTAPATSEESTGLAGNAVPSLVELKQEERMVEREEEDSIARRRESAYRIATERGLIADEIDNHSSKEGTARQQSPTTIPLEEAVADPEDDLDSAKHNPDPANGTDEGVRDA